MNAGAVFFAIVSVGSAVCTALELRGSGKNLRSVVVFAGAALAFGYLAVKIQFGI